MFYMRDGHIPYIWLYGLEQWFSTNERILIMVAMELLPSEPNG